MPHKCDSFADLLRGALGDRLTHADDVLGLFTEDVIFEFPYAPDGFPRRLEGKAALADHLARLAPMLEFGEMALHAVHPADQTVVFEFSCNGQGIRSGAPYAQDYVSVVTLRSGHIARYRDYWNPYVLIMALGGAEAAVAAFEVEAHDG